jgi:hypothetical protein
MPTDASQIATQRDKRRVEVLRPITTMSDQPMVQDNESTDTQLSRDGKN